MYVIVWINFGPLPDRVPIVLNGKADTAPVPRLWFWSHHHSRRGHPVLAWRTDQSHALRYRTRREAESVAAGLPSKRVRVLEVASA